MLWFFLLIAKFNVAMKVCEYVCPSLEKWLVEESYRSLVPWRDKEWHVVKTSSLKRLS